MTRKTLTTALMAVALASVTAFALPTIKITTPDGQNPPNGQQVGGGGGMGGMGPVSFNFQYVSMSKFELTDPDNPRLNVSRNEPGDSVRQRGNSTAGTSVTKKPYRIKFDQKVGLFGKEPAKNWVLLANHFDTTMAKNAIAFRLAKIMGLPYSPSFEYVFVQICNPSGQCTDKGIYLLTEQVEVNKGRVDIDKDNGWLVEFNFHDPDANDVTFTTSAFGLDAFIKSPDIEGNYKGSSISSYPELAFVQTQLNGALNAMNNSSQFSSGAYRDMIDISSFAKFTFLQQFMSNPEWGMGTPGSCFSHKDANGKMTAGPVWDYDLAGNSMGGGWGGGGSNSIETGPNFYKKFFDDEVFRARYRKIWDAHKKDIEAITKQGGFLDSIANILGPYIVANYDATKSQSGGGGGGMSMGGPAANVQGYNTAVSNWKTWINNRVNTFNTAITTGTGATKYDASKDKPDTDKGPVIPDDDPPEQGGVRTLACNGYTLTVNLSVGGSVDLSCNGSTATVTPAPSGNYRFLNWTGDGLSGGVTSSEANPLTLQMTRDRTISANFGQTTPVMLSDVKAANSRLAIVRNGVSLNVVDKAVVKIYGLDGKQIRMVNVTRGSHTVRLGDLPRGMYMVRVSLDGERRTLRVPVK